MKNTYYDNRQYLCNKCNGKGMIFSHSLYVSNANNLVILCSECGGKGKLDWVKNESKINIRNTNLTIKDKEINNG